VVSETMNISSRQKVKKIGEKSPNLNIDKNRQNKNTSFPLSNHAIKNFKGKDQGTDSKDNEINNNE
jgi:hypothetical protein